MDRAVFAIARTEAEAECMLAELRRRGFPDDAASVLFPDRHGKKDFGYEQHSKAPELGALGAFAGGIAGAVLGLVLSSGWWMMPGARHVSAAGPIFGTLACVALVAAILGVIGALIGVRIPEFEAKRYDGKSRRAGILVSVHCEDHRQSNLARQIFSSYGTNEIGIVAAQPASV